MPQLPFRLGRAVLVLARCSAEKLTHVAHGAGGQVSLSQIVDALFTSPVAIVKHVVREYNISYPTARADLKRLADAGSLEEIPTTRWISYYCPAILDITYTD